MSSSRDGATRTHPNYKWLVVAIVGFGILTSTVDGSITNIALPRLAEEFNADPSVIVWVTIAFLLSSVGIMLTLGTLGDAIGRKRVFLTGFLIFGLGLTVAPLSQNLVQLLAARVIQGIGQAMIIANGNALVVSAFPASERGKALGIENAVVGVGLASGPALGGFLLDLWGWQSLFYTRIPFMLIFFVLGLRFLQSDGKGTGQLRFDFLGSLTLFLTVSSFLLSITLGRRFGWTDQWTLLPAMLAPIALIAFLMVESRVKHPVLELSLFRSRLFSVANGANALQFLSQGAIIILLPFFLLDARNLSPTDAGLILGTLPVVRLVVGPFAGWAADKVSSRTITTVGLVIMAVAYLGLRTVGIDTPVALLVTLLLVEGAGSSIFGPGNNSAIMGAVPPTHLGTASGMIATVRQVSQATGIAVAGTFYAIFLSNHEAAFLADGVGADLAHRQASSLGFQEVLTFMVFTLLAAIVVSVLRGRDTPIPTEPDDEASSSVEGHGASAERT